MNRAELICIVRYLESIMNRFRESWFSATNNETKETVSALNYDAAMQALSEYKEMLDELYEDSVT